MRPPSNLPLQLVSSFNPKPFSPPTTLTLFCFILFFFLSQNADASSVQPLYNAFSASLQGAAQPSNQTHHFQLPQQGQSFGASAPASGASGQPKQRVRARRGQATDPHSIAERVRFSLASQNLVSTLSSVISCGLFVLTIHFSHVAVHFFCTNQGKRRNRTESLWFFIFSRLI